MKHILSRLIAPNQSAFIPGRCVVDNVILGFECIHALRQRTRGHSGWAALKLGMSKAYDRVKWSFLEKIMLKLGFDRRWVDLIMQCVSTLSPSPLM